MRTLFCLTLLAILFPAFAGAQNGAPTHPTDGSATLLGTFSANVIYTLGDDSFPVGTQATARDREVGGHTNVCVWRVAGGSVEYVVDRDSITLIGTWDTGDSVAIDDFFDHISRAAVAQGIARGFTPCVTTGTTIARVMNPSCVSRNRNNGNTRLIPCNPNSFCARTFEISCTAGQGSPTITLLPAPPHPPICNGPGCESTCR